MKEASQEEDTSHGSALWRASRSVMYTQVTDAKELTGAGWGGEHAELPVRAIVNFPPALNMVRMQGPREVHICSAKRSLKLECEE